MAGPQPDRQQGLLIGLHGMARSRLVIDRIARLDSEPGLRTDFPVAIAADGPVTFLGPVDVPGIKGVGPLQATLELRPNV